MDLKYRSTGPGSFQPQQQNLPHRPRDYSNSTTSQMPPAFPNFPYESLGELPWPAPVGGNINNMMNLNNGPQFQRHMGSPPPPPPPPLVGPPFHHNNVFAPAPPQHFSSPGPLGAFQQPQFTNGVISPLHSPGLAPVIPHMHNGNGNTFAPAPPSYHNIPPPPGSLGTRTQLQIPPPPNFAMSSFNNPVMHHSSRENGLGHHLGPFPTPPVSAPSSPSPPPPHMINGYSPAPPPPHGMQSLFPLIMSPNLVHNPHMYRSVPSQLPPLSFQSSLPRTVARSTNKSLTPPLAKPNLATSAVVSRNESALVSTNNVHSTSTTLKPKFNPNAVSFQPVVKSPAIVSSTPPPKRAVTPPTKPRLHPFNPLSSHFTPSTCSTPSREEQAEKRAGGKFNPDAPAFVPVLESPPLPARSSPPPNAPTGPASLIPRTNPPPGTSSIPPYPKLPLSPPTGPKADRNRIPPRPIIGLGIGMGAANEIQERGLPATTPLGPKAMSTPTGPRAERSLSRNLSSREGFHSRTYSGSEGPNPREKYPKEPTPLPTVALTRIPGIDKPVPTGPAKMLEDLPPGARIPDVPTAPAAMLKMESGSQNGSDDGSRGRPGFLRRSSSHAYTRSVIRRWSGGVSQNRSGWVREHDESRNASKSRDGSVIPASVSMEIEVTFHGSPKAEDKVPPLTEEPENYDDETRPSSEIHEEAVEEKEKVEVPAPVNIEQETVKEDDESVTVVEEVPFIEESEEPAVVELPLEKSVLPEVTLNASDEEPDSKISVEAIDTAPALIQQPVFTTDNVTEEVVIPVGDKAEEITTAPVVIAVPAVTIPLPSIHIEAEDSSRKEVDLEKDLDTNLEPFPEFSPVCTTSTQPQRLSERRRNVEGDEIVSMMIEDGVVIVPTRDTPSPTAQMRALAKKRIVKGKNKDVIASVKEEVDLVEEDEKDKKPADIKTVPAPIREGSEILNVRKNKKQKKKPKAKKNQTSVNTESEVLSVNATPESTTADEATLEDDMDASLSKNPTNRGAVTHRATTQAVAVQKNSESDVGFIAESPLPVEPVAEAEEVEVIVLDAKDEEKPSLETGIPAVMEEAEKEVSKATSEENDNEKEHDGGVMLNEVDTLPPLPEDIDEQPVKLTVYSDSESVKDEQDDEDVTVPIEEGPIIEVKPLRVVKAATLVPLIEEEPVLVVAPRSEEVIGEIGVMEKEELVPVVAPRPEEVIEEIAVMEKESPVVPVEEPVAIVEEPVAVVEEPVVAVEEPVAVVEEPVVAVEEPVVAVEPVAVESISAVEPVVVVKESPVVIELLEDLLVPTVESPTVEEVVKEAAFFEPRHMHTGEIAVSINSIIDALASCKDINSLSGTLETYSRVSRPGTQEERLFRELHQYAAISDPMRNDSDNRSTKSRSSVRSVRSFFKRRMEAYPQLLSSTTTRIKAILPPFLSMTAAPAINTIPATRTLTPADHKSPMVSAPAAKSQRQRLLPKMTMSLLSRSFSIKSQKNMVA